MIETLRQAVAALEQHAEWTHISRTGDSPVVTYENYAHKAMTELKQLIEQLEKQEPDYRSIAYAIVGNLEGRKQVINLDLEEELVEEIMQEMTDTIRDGFHPAPAVTEGLTKEEFALQIKEAWESGFRAGLREKNI